MELLAVKYEVDSEKRHLCAVDSEVPEVKCVKRRRREPAAVISCDDHQREQPQQLLQQQQLQSSTNTAVKRSSRFRGVSRHRWTGRFEAHLWDKGTWNPTQKKKGKQVYLGAYDEEESAARAYDLAALKYWGATTSTNFPVAEYEKEIEIMQNITKEEYLASLRRRSSGFSRGVSKYRGVARHHHNGRWEARIGRVFGNKYLYLGTYSTQEEAAHAYDIAAIEYRGINAVTNFDLSTYIRWLRPGANGIPTSQKPQTNIEAQAAPSSSNLIPTEKPNSPFLHTLPFTTDNIRSPPKQEIFQGKNHVSTCNKSSSPTALSLLLRSSVFKELVEKNCESTDDEIDGDDTRNQQRVGSDEEYGGIFYNGIGDVPFVSAPSGNRLPSIDLQEENASFFSSTGKSLWNGVLSMSSIH